MPTTPDTPKLDAARDAAEPSAAEWRQLAEHTQRDNAELRQALVEARAELQESGARYESLRRGRLLVAAQGNPQRRWPGLPPILINTLPKSGSVYIAQTLARGLGLPLRSLSYGYFPQDTLDHVRLQAFGRGDAVGQEHVDASLTNLTLLGRFCPRLVVHVRDPRAATLSWVHHLQRLLDDDAALFTLACPAPPPNFASLALSARLDWGIERFLPACVRWINGWCSAPFADHGLTVRFTRYEQFHRDPGGFFTDLLAFHGLDPKSLDWPQVERTRENNFRAGRIDEWHEAFTPQQRRDAEALIPTTMLERFGWNGL